MTVPPCLLTAFPPSNRLLLDVSRRQIDDGMLDEIAAADYGIDADRHLAALRPIRDTGTVPQPMGWHPGEVLELIRWSEPENAARKPGATGRRGHQMRAFACAVLLRAAAEGGDTSSEEATLGQCLASAKVLGQEMNDAVAGFLTWRIPLMTGPDDWLFAVGLLIASTRPGNDRITDRVLVDATAWVLGAEGEFRRGFRFNPADPPPVPFGLRYGVWKPVLTELTENAATVKSAGVRSDLELIGRILLEET
jgi:hypothetical protein